VHGRADLPQRIRPDQELIDDGGRAMISTTLTLLLVCAPTPPRNLPSDSCAVVVDPDSIKASRENGVRGVATLETPVGWMHEQTTLVHLQPKGGDGGRGYWGVARVEREKKVNIYTEEKLPPGDYTLTISCRFWRVEDWEKSYNDPTLGGKDQDRTVLDLIQSSRTETFCSKTIDVKIK
jgi:hypothetical protein